MIRFSCILATASAGDSGGSENFMGKWDLRTFEDMLVNKGPPKFEGIAKTQNLEQEKVKASK